MIESPTTFISSSSAENLKKFPTIGSHLNEIIIESILLNVNKTVVIVTILMILQDSRNSIFQLASYFE